MFKNIQKNKGYTLLFAVMVSSLVLAVGISILNISKKEFLLSSSARESITAFYAADSALECAVYHDNKSDIFSAEITDMSSIKCLGNSMTRYSFTSGTGSITHLFHMSLKDSDTSTACAIVTRIKNTNNGQVQFISRGYNMGWNTTGGGAGKCDTPSPRRVERALHYTYNI